jgi:hypothetical protein
MHFAFSHGVELVRNLFGRGFTQTIELRAPWNVVKKDDEEVESLLNLEQLLLRQCPPDSVRFIRVLK